LGPILKIHVIHLDRIFWKRGWEEKPRDTRIDILQALVQENRWIIEGSYLSSSEPRLNAADTIIFLDIAPILCLWHIIKRHRDCHGRSRRDIPQGCTDKLTLFLMFKVLVFPFQERRALEEKLCKFPSEKVIRLRSTKEVEDFVAKLESHADERGKFSKTPSGAGKRHSPAVRR
jgi:adenylate kinase family enzyme